MPLNVYLLTEGDGSDGDEWKVISIHSCWELAQRAKAKYEAPREGYGGILVSNSTDIEKWPVEI